MTDIDPETYSTIMNWFTLVVAGAFGAVFGSFSNVAIYRIPRDNLSVSNPKLSFCPKCRKQIRWYDNIPLISYLLLLGKCRNCREKISLRYPLVELICALLFVMSAYYFALPGKWLEFGVACVFCLAMVIITFIDIDYRIIPDVIDKPGMVIAPILSFAVPSLHIASFVEFISWFGISWEISGSFGLADRGMAVLSSLFGIAVGAGLTYGVGVAGKAVFRKEAMGFGDVKLMGMIGGILGWQAVVITFFLGSMIGAVVGVTLMVVSRRKDPHIAFGPFLASGAVLVLFYEEQIRHFVLVTYPRWLAGV